MEHGELEIRRPWWGHPGLWVGVSFVFFLIGIWLFQGFFFFLPFVWFFPRMIKVRARQIEGEPHGRLSRD